MFLSATCALATVLLSAPPATETAPPAAAPAPAAKPSPRAPAAPDAALAPLGFLEGHWVTTLPNGMVSEESWLPVRGKSMLGSFRQTRPDGNPAFFEFTQVVATDKGVVLRQVHVHSRFETDERRKEPMFLKLAKAEDDAATFVPVGDGEFGEGTSSHAGDLASVTYARTKAEDGSDRLTLRIESRPVKDPKKPDAEPQPQVIEITMKRAS
jgi:pyruvate/2-oxoglutarate dehydrogenase complex dihydrolipoamide acyltransferase (E2) component